MVEHNNDFVPSARLVNATDSISLGYDDDLLLTSADALTFDRDLDHGLVTGSEVGTVTTTTTYNTFGELLTFAALEGTNELVSLDYDRDDLGRITEVIETRGSTTTTTEYVYDADGRLEEVIEDSVSVMSMGYDDNGNRTSITTSSGTTSCTYDAQDRLVSCGDIDYGFDDDGDLISRTDTVANETTDCGCDSRGRWTR